MTMTNKKIGLRERENKRSLNKKIAEKASSAKE
jgi:hypothetical protein